MEKLGGSLQENLLVLLCWSDTSFQLVRNSVTPNLFTTDIYRDIITRVFEYIDQFKKPPKDHLPDLLEDALEGKSGSLYRQILKAVRTVKETINEEYVLNQLGDFVRLQTLKLGIIRASELMQTGDLEEAEVELEKSLKHRLSLFHRGLTLEEGLKNLEKSEGNTREALRLGIKELDKYHLGPARKELHALIGSKKSGKTWWLLHLAKRALMMGHKVAYISLEVSEQLLATRMLQSLYSLTLGEAKKVVTYTFDKDELGRITSLKKESHHPKSLLTSEGRRSAHKGNRLHTHSKHLRIKEFPTGSLTIQGLKAYLDALERMDRFVPDLVLVDYPKLMRHDSNNLRIDLGITIERLRGLASERNMMVAVVGQGNREGVQANTMKGIHAAEDFSITMTADIVLTYSQTGGEHQLGLARIGVDSSRISRQHFDTMISQSYDMGQFCLDSAPMASKYFTMVKESSGKDLDDLEI